MTTWKIIDITKKTIFKLNRLYIYIDRSWLSVALCLFILFISIIFPAYGMKTINGTVSVKQEGNLPSKLIYIINLSTSTSSMPLESIKLSVGSDINDTSVIVQYTVNDSQNKDLKALKRINLKQDSNILISIPVDFNSSRLNAGDFANWISDVNGTNYWDKAWYRAEIIPLVGDPEILEATGIPRFVKSGCIADDSESIEIRTNQHPQIELKSPPNMRDFYITNFSPSIEVIFKYKPSDDVSLKNCTLYFNNMAHYPSEDWPENNNNYTFKRNLNLSGNYTWYIKCYDNEGKCADSDIRYFNVNYDNPPFVSLNPHKNASFAINKPVEFRCKADDDQKISGCALYIDNSSVNSTPLVKNNEYAFTHTFLGKDDIGVHEWYVQCCDNSSQCSYSSERLPVYVVPSSVVYVQKYIPPDYCLPYIAYDKISDAISESSPWGTIIVTPGDYYERNIIIDKPLNLTGLDYPTIKGDNIYDSLIIKSNNVTIQGFKILDSKIGIYASIEDGNISYCDINIHNNIISGGEYGVAIDGYNNLENIVIRNNDIINPRYGITLLCQDYIELESYKGMNIIDKNSISGGKYGIWLVNCSQLNIYNNTLNSNVHGIYARDCQSGVINSNNIFGSNFGITICESNLTTIGNIYKNTDSKEVRGC